MTEAFLVGQDRGAKAGPESTPFYIPSTSSFLESRHLTLKQGDTFGVFDHYGDVASRGGGPEGLFHKDTRYLSDLRVLVNGLRPLLLSSTVQDNNVLLTAELTNPDFFSGGRSTLRATGSTSSAQNSSGRARAMNGLGSATSTSRRAQSKSPSASPPISPTFLSFAAMPASGAAGSKRKLSITD